MKQLLFLALTFPLAVLAGGQYGGGTRNDVNTVNNSNSGAYAGNQGNSQNITFQGGQTPIHQKISNVPSPSSNFVTTSDDTCQGSQAGSAGWLGFGGSAASTYTVIPCDRRKNALVLNAVGERDTAVQIMCTDPTVYTTRKAMGLSCVVKPDMTTYVIPGGQVGNLAIPTGAKFSPALMAQSIPPHEHNQYATVPMVDNAFKHGMAK